MMMAIWLFVAYFANAASWNGVNKFFVSLDAHMITVGGSDSGRSLAKSKKQMTQLFVSHTICQSTFVSKWSAVAFAVRFSKADIIRL